jgi:hypothetical protein
MLETYCIEDIHPEFKDGDTVLVDMEKLGGKKDEIRPGTIVGIGCKNLVDFWLVEGNFNSENYPYRVASIPHIAILKS